MTNTEQRIAEIQKQLDELKASLEKKDDGLWVPSIHGSYYYINEFGNVDANDLFINECIEFRNVFQTEEQALRHAKRLKLYNKLWRLAEHLNGDWVPNFDGGIQEAKHVIEFDHEEKKFEVRLLYECSFGTPVFETKELAGKAISMLTDEEKDIFKNIYSPK